MIKLVTRFLPFILIMIWMSNAFGQEKDVANSLLKNPFERKTSNSMNEVVHPTRLASLVGSKSVKGISINDGVVRSKFTQVTYQLDEIRNNLVTVFGLNDAYKFELKNEHTDELGLTHYRYQQYFKGFPIDGKEVIIHSKEGLVYNLNGHILEATDIVLERSITGEVAISKAMNYLKVTDLLNEKSFSLCILPISNGESSKGKMCYKIRIDTDSPLSMCYVYVDAKTGEILKRLELVPHADTNGTGVSRYSGSRSIVCDSYSSGYRLKDNSRNITTLDATHAETWTNQGYSDANHITSSTTTFSSLNIIKSVTISTVTSSWWYAIFVDELPDLYIVIRDDSSNIVYVSNTRFNTRPTLVFDNINVYVKTSNYTIEIWDYDGSNNDDFGGSFSVDTKKGTNSWSNSGGTGTYEIGTSGDPSIDVHWGMEVVYDFYKSEFNRTSFDGNGGRIIQFVNPPDLQQYKGKSPNNAYAMGSPYNVMLYGLGDGQYMNPLVSIDVEGHEFTHLVIDNNGNGGLKYESESGALNESFADIFGTCIEYYSKVDPDWKIGEEIMVSAGNLRSMSDPNSSGGGPQPDTYKGTYWVNTENLDQDHGGVHTNSGVQNFWFYLLSEGGSGTNDNGSSYSVSGIGIDKAKQIAYRNLVTYLTSTASYDDAYYGSIQAAEDLYGNSSNEYKAVRDAWYAVGIGTNPNSFCDGVVTFSNPSGKVSDGSGSANYKDNSECFWVIAPPGAEQITLNFTSFDTETDFDTVLVYDGPDDTHDLLAVWWGTSLPPTIKTTSGVGAMCIKFVSDDNTTGGGWSANYTSSGVTPSCDGAQILSSSNGTLDDGSGSANYGNNQLCYWIISPPCATSVTLSFSSFNTEEFYDGVVIYDGWEDNSKELAVYTGANTPSSVTSNTGKMLVIFVSDYSTTMGGFNANYTSKGSAFCSETTTLNTSDHGTITDGSGNNNYCNNQNCGWIIQPPQATSVTLTFTEFNVEDASADGQTVYDVVKVYDGTSASDPLLGSFTGSNLPPQVTSNGGSLYIHFTTDLEENFKGWSADYTSTQDALCKTDIKLSAANGSFSDGSGTNDYANNSYCSWLIQPPSATKVSLSFSMFSTEQDKDGVVVYDGADNSAQILGQFSGTSTPPTITSTGGEMYVEFLTDGATRGSGWVANYTSSSVGIGESFMDNEFDIFPNPSSGSVNVVNNSDSPASLFLMDITGKITLTREIPIGGGGIEFNSLSSGTYLVKIITPSSILTRKLIIQ